MFNSLIESAPHRDEYQRRGSFFIGTLAAYAVLFLITGVASIYAYDAHLESGTMEMLAMVEPVPPIVEETRPRTPNERPRAPESRSEQPTHDTRTALVASVNNPAIVPEKISSKAGDIPPVRDNMPVALGDVNTNGEAEPGARFSDGRGPASVKVVPSKIITEEPPPIKTPTPAPEKKIFKASSLLNGQARRLPNPPYPELAKRAGAQGIVAVQILINEQGKVVSAHAVGGNPLLRVASEQAAMQALFSPTILNGEAVKVSGTITFNFVLH